MNYQIKINSLAAGIRNGEAVINRFNQYFRKSKDFGAIKRAYPEQAGHCIDCYRSMIADGVPPKSTFQQRTEILTVLNNWTGELDRSYRYFSRINPENQSEKSGNSAPAWTPPPRIPCSPERV